MPVYVYQGLETGNRYEFEQRFSDAAYTHHPETGEPIKRVISAPAVIFKGSGWYVKDSKSASSTTGKGEGKGESKTEPSSQAAD
ncbi:MAG: FmdB family transcriptional regulator [Meiothermus sp.]